MAGLPEIAKPLGKAAPPRAGKAEASAQLCPSCVRSHSFFPAPSSSTRWSSTGCRTLTSPGWPCPLTLRIPGGWGLAADADGSASHSLPGCLAQATLAGHEPQLASTPGRTEAHARPQLVPQPRNLGSRCLRSLPAAAQLALSSDKIPRARDGSSLVEMPGCAWGLCPAVARLSWGAETDPKEVPK